MTRVRILSWGHDDTVRLWDASTGRELVPAMRHEGSGLGAARILSWGGFNVRLWDASTGRELVPAMGHNLAVWRATFSPDESHILSAGADAVRLWDASTGRELVPAMRYDDRSDRSWGVDGVVFSRDGSRILIWGGDTVRL